MSRGTWGGALDPNIFKVNIRFTNNGQHCQTGFKLRDAVTNDNSAQDVAEEVDTQLRAGFKSLLTFIDGVELIDVIKLGTEEGGVVQLSPSDGQGTVNDSSSTVMVPSFNAVNIAMKSEIRKRYGQGRMFLPIVSQDWINGNVVNNSGVTVLNSFLDVIRDHFMGAPETHDLILVNAHAALPVRGAPGNPDYRPAIPASWYDVVSLRINGTITSVRSRKSGVGA